MKYTNYMNTDKKKLNKNDLIKIKARYESKCEEFRLMTIEQLSELDKTKMSSNDNKALRTAALELKIKEWKSRNINNEGLIIQQNE